MSELSLAEYIDKLSHALGVEHPEGAEDEFEELDHVLSDILIECSREQHALILEAFPIQDRKQIWRRLSVDTQKEIFFEMKAESRNLLLNSLRDEESYQLFDSLEADDLLYLDDTPDNFVRYALSKMDEKERSYYEIAQGYSQDEIAHWQSFDRIRVTNWVRVDNLKRFLPENLPDLTEVVYVVDFNGKLLGEVSLSQVIKHQGNRFVSEIMTDCDNTLLASSDTLTACDKVINSYKSALPVVDEENRLLGRVDVSSAIGIRETLEPVVSQKVTAPVEEDLFASVWESSKGRALWLGINLLTAFLASATIALFEGTIEKVVALAVLMPVVASMGGISGSQSLTLVIRGLALEQITHSNRKTILLKEMKVGLVNGLIWASVIGAATFWWFDNPMLGLTISLAVLLNLIAAPLTGVVVPIILEKFHIDPALSGSVILTTITDIVGFLVFLGIGTLILIH